MGKGIAETPEHVYRFTPYQANMILARIATAHLLDDGTDDSISCRLGALPGAIHRHRRLAVRVDCGELGPRAGGTLVLFTYTRNSHQFAKLLANMAIYRLQGVELANPLVP